MLLPACHQMHQAPLEAEIRILVGFDCEVRRIMGERLELLIDGGTFFEAPRWHQGRWWVSDFYSHKVMSVTHDGVVQEEFEIDDQPSGLGWLPDGSLLVVGMKNRTVIRRDLKGRLSPYADLSQVLVGHANDMVVTRDGQAYVGSFGFDLMAGEDPRLSRLARIAPDGSISVAADGLAFPNGCVISADGSMLVVAETFGCALTAFRIDPSGSLTEKRTWAQLAPRPKLGRFEDSMLQVAVAPDGCALDAEGAIWVADVMGNRLLRVAEGGAVLDELEGPEGGGVFACMLGGYEGHTLLVCCSKGSRSVLARSRMEIMENPDDWRYRAAPRRIEDERSVTREASLWTIQVKVPRAGLP
jgi:sugar lactone lactonase YvrE